MRKRIRQIVTSAAVVAGLVAGAGSGATEESSYVSGEEFLGMSGREQMMFLEGINDTMGVIYGMRCPTGVTFGAVRGQAEAYLWQSDVDRQNTQAVVAIVAALANMGCRITDAGILDSTRKRSGKKEGL